MKINSKISKSTTLGIILLFIGIAVQPGIATVPLNEEINDETKEYLFQTIIDIANNPDVNDFLKQNNHNKIISDYGFKDLYSKLLVENPESFTSMLFTKPTITHDYLDKIFNIGVEMVDILGEEQVYEMRDTIMVSNTEVYDELKNIIFNDEELSNRIGIIFNFLRGIVCLSLLIIMLPVVMLYIIADDFFDSFSNLPGLLGDIGLILYVIFVWPLLFMSVALLGLTGAICLEYD